MVKNNPSPSFFSTLFGTIAGSIFPSTGMDFLPKDENGGFVAIKDVVWLGLRSPLMQKASYDFCYAVASVVERLAELDLNGELEILKIKGKGKDDYATSLWAQQTMELLKNPNPEQNWEIFRAEQKIFARVFGYSVVWGIKPTGMSDPVMLVNLPPWMIDFTPNNEWTPFSPINNRIKKITYTINGRQVIINPMDCMILEDGFVKDERNNNLTVQSKLVGLDMAISNLCAAMEADNVLLKKRGPLGFISHDAAATKDSLVGYMPMKKWEKNALQRDLRLYGLTLGQFQYVISRTAAKWNPMSYDVKQLGTKETVIQSEKSINHRYNHPYVLFEVSDSTFSNADAAHLIVYENTVVPSAERDMAVYNKFFKAAENDCKITLCFDDISVFQEDEKSKGDANLANDNAYEKEWLNDVITLNMWRQARGYDSVPGDDVYYSEYSKRGQTAQSDQQPIEQQQNQQ